MTNPPFITPEIKSTSPIDFVESLKGYIGSEYEQDWRLFKAELEEINKLRMDVLDVESNSLGRDVLFRYSSQLDLLELRFPINEENIMIQFEWIDTIIDEAVDQCTIAYEKANILYNLAVVLSDCASTYSREEDYKKACNHYQAAAGVFLFINDNFLHAPTLDLSKETLNIMKNLMLVQAQECFVLKSIKGNIALKTVPKLCSWINFTYTHLIELINEHEYKAYFIKHYKDIFNLKACFYESMMYYIYGLNMKKDNKVGVAVSSLKIAHELADKSIKNSSSINRYFRDQSVIKPETVIAFNRCLKDHFDQTKHVSESLLKENDTIYHELVLRKEDLPKILKTQIVKPILVADLYGDDVHRIVGEDIFKNLVPMFVYELLSLYLEHKKKFVENEAEKVQISDAELTTSYNYMKLTEILDKVKEPEYVINNTNNEQFENKELHKKAKELKNSVNELRTKGNNYLKNIDNNTRILNQYLFDFQKNKKNSNSNDHKIEWLIQSYDQLRENLLEAIKIDKNIVSEYDKNKEFIEIIQNKKGESYYKKISADSNVKNNTSLLDDVDESESLNETIKNIENIMQKLSDIRYTRNKQLNILKEQSNKEDINTTTLLYIGQQKEEEVVQRVFDTHLSKYKHYIEIIDTTISEQKKYIEQLAQVYKSLMTNNKTKQILKKYDTINTEITKFLAKYVATTELIPTLIEKAKKAFGFYRKLEQKIENYDQQIQNITMSTLPTSFEKIDIKESNSKLKSLLGENHKPLKNKSSPKQKTKKEINIDDLFESKYVQNGSDSSD